MSRTAAFEKRSTETGNELAQRERNLVRREENLTKRQNEVKAQQAEAKRAIEENEELREQRRAQLQKAQDLVA